MTIRAAGTQDRFYIYMYWDTDGVPRYVGLGKTARRWKSHLTGSSNPRLRHKVAKLRTQGIVMPHAKVAENLTAAEAIIEEKRLIALHGRANLDDGGTLYNRTLGGDGTLGVSRSRPQTEAERKKRSETIAAFWQSEEGLAKKARMAVRSSAQMSTPEAKARTARMGSARKGRPGKPQTSAWKAMIGRAVAQSNRRRVWTQAQREEQGRKSRAAWARRRIA